MRTDGIMFDSTLQSARAEALRRVMSSLCAMAIAGLIAAVIFAGVAYAEPQRIALLGVHFQNDNEGYEPTTDAEKNRLNMISTAFKEQLEASGKYAFVPVPASEQQKIDAGQLVGACGGCEFDYGRDLNVEHVAWIRVQKISNLILNINVYMADVAKRKVTFIHSVDLRNNTDESWMRGLNYLLQNYLLPGAQG
jgi:hypothetical protein